jgi:hypothetical protein
MLWDAMKKSSTSAARRRTALSLATALLALSPLALVAQSPAQSPAQTPATQPAPAPGKAAASETLPLRVTVTAVQGMVQVRAAEDQPWKVAEPGMELGQGADFRTGPRSAVQFRIPPDQTITLDRLGTVKVINAVREAGTLKTDIGMRYGRTRFDVEGSGGESHEASIRSPSATLAIRGTIAVLYDQGFYEPQYTSLSHVVDRQKNGTSTPFGGDEPATFGESDAGPAELAKLKSDSLVGGYRAFTTEELALFHDMPDYVGNFLRDAGFFKFRNLDTQTTSRNRYATRGTDANLTTSINPFNIRVFDNSSPIEDGDSVKLIFNGSVIANNLVLTTEGQTYSLNLKKGNNRLTLINTSNGNDGVNGQTGEINTAAIAAPVGGTVLTFTTTVVGETRSANIRYVPTTQPSSSRRR